MPIAQLLKHLRNPRYADYARLFGFQDGVFPTEGGLRHWLTALGHHSQNGDTVTVPVDEDKLVDVAVEHLNQLIAQSVTLLLDGGFLSHQAWEEALICPDGMIHDVASRLNCGCVTDTCYQPTSAENPRPCPARAISSLRSQGFTGFSFLSRVYTSSLPRHRRRRCFADWKSASLGARAPGVGLRRRIYRSA